MVVDHRDLPGRGERVPEQVEQQPMGPGRRVAAEEDPLGVAVLPTGHRLLQGARAVGLGVGVERRLGLGDHRVVPFLGADRLLQRGVALVDRVGGAVVDEVAVEVDVVLGHPAQPGEAVGVDRVDLQQRRVRWHLLVKAALQPADLDAGTAESLGAVGRREGDEHGAGVARAEPGGVGEEGFARRPGRGAAVAPDRRAGPLAGAEEGRAGRAVVGREIGRGAHAAARVAVTAAAPGPSRPGRRASSPG